MIDRRDVIEALARDLAASAAVRAAWLGGSDANGRTDGLSDVDVFMVAARGGVEAASQAVEASLAQLSPIRRRFRLPMPTWHGFEQAFYQLADAPEHLMVDWLIVEQGRAHPWLEVERHGTPVVLFDKDGDCAPVHADAAVIAGAVRRKVRELRVRFPMFRHMAGKLARRGLPADAAHFYQSLVLRPLVDMLRCVHCPERHDFGFRYLRDDLPGESYQLVCRLAYPAGVESIEGMVQEASAAFERALREWDAREGETGRA